MSQVNAIPSEIIIEDYMSGSRVRNWLINLVTAVTNANYCSQIFSSKLTWEGGFGYGQRRTPSYTIRLVGKSVNIIACKLMLDYLLKTIKRLGEEQKGAGREAIESFKVGIVTSLCIRLYEIRRNSEFGSTESKDLVVVADAEVKNKVNEIITTNKAKGNKMKASDLAGYYMGRQVGDNISLNTQVSGKTEGPKEAIGYAG
jgi:hypothetical protein